MMRGLIWLGLLAHSVLGQSSQAASAVSSGATTGVTDIPVYNATIAGTPTDTTVQSVPDELDCNYTSSDDLYCFPSQNAFVSMTGWTRFFYNQNYGLINGSGLVDITMHFAADDQPAASWIGVQNTGNVPINVNISWFTTTLSPQATYSAADPYYFYVRPNSAVYNAYPTGSSRGPTFYAVQTPSAKLVVAASPTATPTNTNGAASAQPSSTGAVSGSSAQTTSPTSSSGSGSGLSRGAIAGIAIGAIALFFVLVLLGIVIVLLLRRQRYAEEAAAAAADNQEKQRQRDIVTGNLYTPAELAAAGLVRPGQRARSQENSDSSGSAAPYIIHQNPLSHQSSIVRPERARVVDYSRNNGSLNNLSTSPSGQHGRSTSTSGTWIDNLGPHAR